MAGSVAVVRPGPGQAVQAVRAVWLRRTGAAVLAPKVDLGALLCLSCASVSASLSALCPCHSLAARRVLTVSGPLCPLAQKTRLLAVLIWTALDFVLSSRIFQIKIR